MFKIIWTNLLFRYFVLLREKYFSFEENAIEYVQKLSEYIDHNIHKLPHEDSPKNLKKHDDFYVFYESNKRTTWYFFFNKKIISI